MNKKILERVLKKIDIYKHWLLYQTHLLIRVDVKCDMTERENENWNQTKRKSVKTKILRINML